jgi:hypothetical protein
LVDLVSDLEARVLALEACAERYVDQGDGTVLDCNTQLVWLKDASCDALGPVGIGLAKWDEAEAAAAELAWNLRFDGRFGGGRLAAADGLRVLQCVGGFVFYPMSGE